MSETEYSRFRNTEEDPAGMQTEEFTKLLQSESLDADQRAERILPVVYEQLRAIASRAMSEESSGHTLQATALVHEAYLKLLGGREVPWQSRGHFYIAAAESIRQILLDHAKSKRRIKRGGGASRIALELSSIADLADADADAVLTIEEAFSQLENEDDRAALVFRLRLYAGMTCEQIGRVLDLSERTVEREWAYARRWMARVLLERDG